MIKIITIVIFIGSIPIKSIYSTVVDPNKPLIKTNRIFSSEILAKVQDSKSNMLFNETSIKPRIHLRVATLELAPFMMRRNKANFDLNDKSEWIGYCIDFFHELIRHLPYEITYEMYFVPGNKFGTKLRKTVTEHDAVTNRTQTKVIDTWTGIMGELVLGRADLALTPLAVMAERELVIDFTVPFYDLVGIQILLKRPEVNRDIFKFLTVLDNEVWLSIAIAFFITSTVIFLFDRLSPYSHKNSARIKCFKKHHRNITNDNDRNGGRSIFNTNRISNASESQRNLPLSKIKNVDVNSYEMTMIESSPKILSSSWTGTLLESRRKSSLFFTNQLSSILRRKGIYPNDPTNLVREDRRSSRTSRSLKDYFNHINNHQKLRSSDSYPPHHIYNSDGKPDFSFKDSLWFCITSLTPQGGGEAPMNLSGRVVAGAWWLFCFIIIASYTANLAAYLTVSRLDIPIDSLDDLVKQYRIKYAPVEGTAEHAFFERMAYIEEIFYNIWRDISLNKSLTEEERSRFAVWDYPISDKYTKIWAQIQQVGMPVDHESGLERVKNSTLEEGFALLADANIIKQAVITDCTVKAVGDEFSRKPIALGVRKGLDTFRDALSHAILKLINQRFMEILREKWWSNNPDRVICYDTNESEGIGLQNIGGVFIIIGAGICLSFLAWLVERFSYQTRLQISKDLISSH